MRDYLLITDCILRKVRKKPFLFILPLLLTFSIIGCASAKLKKEVQSSEAPPVSTGEVTQQLSFQEIPVEKALSVKEERERKEYLIGVGDTIEVKVLEDEKIDYTQEVQPDGKISLFLIGDIYAAEKTTTRLREDITNVLQKYVVKPHVTVRVTGYKSKKTYIFGEIKTPGIFPLNGDMYLLDAIAHAGGLTQDADIRGSLLTRNGQFIPVDFESLLKKGDLQQNVLLEPYDIIYFPSILDRKVYVLGEVNRPGVYNIRGEMNIMEAVSLAGGFTRDAKEDSLLLIRGGLNSPKVAQLSYDDKTKEMKKGSFLNLASIDLESQDIIYVSPTKFATVERFFQRFHSIIEPIVWAERAVVFSPDVERAFLGRIE